MTTVQPFQPGLSYVTDGGMETDLIFHHGVDLPGFAAFVLLDSATGRRRLRDYYSGYAEIAAAAGAGLLLEAPTWRANPDWGAQLGYDADALRRVNAAAIEFLLELREDYLSRGVRDVVVGGMVGPRGDGYAVGSGVEPAAAADYHRGQIEAFATAGAALVTGYTFTDVGEARGVVLAARAAGLPVGVSFTVETDGRLPGGLPLRDAYAAVEESAPADHYLVNCAHVEHVLAGLVGVEPPPRLLGIRANASVCSHAELDEATELDEGDLGRFVAGHRRLDQLLGGLRIVGGCCGTDVRHVAALWGQGEKVAIPGAQSVESIIP